MQTLPAGIAIFIAEVCLGLVMVGVHRFAPDDKCLRYWALAMLLTGVGILIVTENAGALNYSKLVLGNFCIIFGGICHWWGIQSFYRRRASRFGWTLVGAFLLLFGLALAAGASMPQRALILSCFVLAIVALNLREVGNGHRRRHTFASRLTVIGILILLGVYSVRVVLLLFSMAASTAPEPGVYDVILLYFIPLAGMLLFDAGLMLMYFERIIAENRRLANEDALTGLLNRGAIVAAGERAVAHALQHRESLTVAILDIDFFKNINDSLGHDAGDEALADFARLLNAHCRQQDLVGRYGGEEFCIVFPGMDEPASLGAAQRILEAARRYRLRQAYSLTVSIGMAVLSPQAPAASWAELIKAADQQLYLAKQGGRDQCRRTSFAGARMAPEPDHLLAIHASGSHRDCLSE